MIGKLYPYLGAYKMKTLLCVFLTLGEVICELRLPLVMGQIVDTGIYSGQAALIKLGAQMVILAVLALVFGVLNARFSSEVSQGFTSNLRQALFEKIQTFSFSNIDRFSSASLITRMTSDMTQLQNTLMMTLRMLTRAPFMLIIAYTIAAMINLRLSLVILVSICVLFLFAVVLIKMAGKMFGVLQQKLDAVNNTVQENLIAIRVVKAFVREAYEKLKFKEVNDDLTGFAKKLGAITAFIMPMMTLVVTGTNLAAIWYGGNMVSSGILGSGQFLSFISYIMQILMSVMIFSMIFVMLTRAKACAERAAEVLDAVPDVRDTVTDAGAPKVRTGAVEFRDVSFRYNGNGTGSGSRNVLSNISFAIHPGEFVGIVGGTGSGKTSLINLIPRFYDVREGSVLVDGRDVRDYRQEDLRDGIGMVLQKNNLFSGTIRENLLWGNDNATQEEMEQAARDAQAHDFIMSFPKGYDTELGQGGVNVSGGQKQRLCIARAMIKRPPILILDDSTSAVDTSTEARIRHSFHENFKDSTVFLVAQRISSVLDADKIIVLDDGEISGIGTHEELMESNHVYREIYNSQMERGAA